VLDCYLDERGSSAAFLPGGGVHFERVRAAHIDPALCPTDARAFAGIVISGSAAHILERRPWMLALERLVRSAHTHRVPTLGVCFGHQLIASALLGPGALRPMPEPEYGWRELELLRPGGFLARALHAVGTPEDPRPRLVFVSHSDEVVLGAPGSSELLVHARSACSAVQAYQVRGTPIFGLQFHSELPLDEARELFVERTTTGPERWTLLDRSRMLQRAVDRSALWRQLFGRHLDLCGLRPGIELRRAG